MSFDNDKKLFNGLLQTLVTLQTQNWPSEVWDVQFTLVISNTDNSKYPYIKEYSFGHISYFPSHSAVEFSKLLVSQSKFSGTRKFTLRCR